MDNDQQWQSQNFKKTGPQCLTTGSMHPKLGVAKYADGGEVLKEEGLAASNSEAPVGFFKRLSQGNIDDPKSEAYQAYGAGRGQRERDYKVISKESDDIAEMNAQVTAQKQAAEANKPQAATPGKYSKDDFEGVDEAIARNKESTSTPSAPMKASASKPSASKPSAPAKPSASTKEPAKASSSVFSDDVADRKSKTVTPVKSDTTFDANALNFTSPTSASKTSARTIEKPTPRRGYLSGGTGKTVAEKKRGFTFD